MFPPNVANGIAARYGTKLVGVLDGRKKLADLGVEGLTDYTAERHLEVSPASRDGV